MPPDADPIIRSYLEGDETAFRTLLEAQTTALRARIERRMAPLLRRRVSVHDVMQEVSIIAFEQRAEFTGRTPEEFQRWIGGIADRSVHAQFNHYAGTQKRALHQEISRSSRGETIHPVSPEPSPSQQAIGSELEVLAAQALELLPPDYREVLRRHRENGSSLKEIAVSMGRSYDATKKLHGRAMLRFAEHFKHLRGSRDD